MYIKILLCISFAILTMRNPGTILGMLNCVNIIFTIGIFVGTFQCYNELEFLHITFCSLYS